MTLRRTALTRRTELRRTPMKRQRKRTSSIRSLRHADPIPDGEPRRYVDGRGYIRLRWKVGTEQYVEEYEHRLVMGRPLGEVHHINGDKADNRPENLVVLSKREHAALHMRLDKEANPHMGAYDDASTARGRRNLGRADRRAQRCKRVEQMQADYKSGMTTIEIGEKYGVHHSNVSRTLRSAGTRMRQPAIGTSLLRRNQQVVKARASMRCERCGRLTAWEGGQVHHRLPRGAGGSSRPEIHCPSNLLLLCRGCHEWVESQRTASYASGWLVKRGTDPASVPVEVFGQSLVLLTPDGEYRQVTP